MSEVKFCKHCNIYLSINNFRLCKYKSGITYRKSICKKSESILQVERVRKNGKSKERSLKEKIYKKQYIKNNKDKINAKYKQNLHSNINFKLRKNISRQILRSIKSKNCSFLLKIGYSIEDLKINIESKFEDWMNWDNLGVYKTDEWKDDDKSTWKWQLDHIIPQSDLPYDSMDHPNFKKCWELNNLRPLSAKINIIDGATRARHKK